MNLYRNFGSLLETWVTEGYPTLDFAGQPEGEGEVEVEGVVVGVGQGQREGVVPGARVDAFRSGSRDSLQFSGATARSESEDSGVELASPGSPWASQQHAMVVALKASGAGGSEGPDGGVIAAPPGEEHLPVCSSSPALSTRSCPSSPSSSSSSSSSCQSVGSELCPLAADEGPPSGAKVERALQRADPARRQIPRRGVSLGGRADLPAPVQRRRSIASHAGHTGHTEGPQDYRGQRSLNVTPTLLCLPQVSKLMPMPLCLPQVSKLMPTLLCLPQVSKLTPTLLCLPQVSGAAREGWTELSSGFVYLEQVCLMLERIAHLQSHQRGLQVEMEQLRNQQNQQTHTTQRSTQQTGTDPCFGVHITESANHRHGLDTQMREASALCEEYDILTELRRRSSSDVGRLTPCHRKCVWW
ncbi:hypothetical protein ACEWY4_004848 [Coilia grayii]|uniref:Uncharacterized protein n=1 Tax=Coilia grayii TaxID=363190 RepID=A0ABD1KMP6_9TELE